MVVLNTPDGAKQFNGWRDTSRNEDCSFVPTSDGMTRCAPIAASGVTYGVGSFYADAACSVPVARVTCSVPPTYLMGATLNSCATAWDYGPVNLRGQPYPSAYQKSGATCTAIAVNASITYYGLGAAVALTEFQAGTLAVE